MFVKIPPGLRHLLFRVLYELLQLKFQPICFNDIMAQVIVAFQNCHFHQDRPPEICVGKVPISAARKVYVEKIGSERMCGYHFLQRFLSGPFWRGSRDPSIAPHRHTRTVDH